MATVSRPYTYSPNTLIESAKNSSNETTLYNLVNGALDGDNVSAIVESKITMSATGHAHSGGAGGAPIQLVKGTDITSAGTIAIPTDGNYFDLTGSTGPITSLGTRNSGVLAFLRCASTPTFTYNATTLKLFGAANYTAVANDVLGLVSLGAGNWQQIEGPAGALTTAQGSYTIAAGATGTTTTAHGLGKTPKLVIVMSKRDGIAAGFSFGWGISSSSRQTFYQATDATSLDQSQALVLRHENAAATAHQSGDMTTLDATNIVITNTTAGGGYALRISWVAIG